MEDNGSPIHLILVSDIGNKGYQEEAGALVESLYGCEDIPIPVTDGNHIFRKVFYSD